MKDNVIMRRRLPVALLLAGLIVLAVPAIGGDEKSAVLAPRADHPGTATHVLALLDQAHQRDQDLDDALSGRLLDRYLKYLDPARVSFCATDIAGFEALRTKLDDELGKGELTSAYLIYNRLLKRQVERLGYLSGAVAAGLDKLDFDAGESLSVDREFAPWPADAEASRALWRKLLKSDVLSLLLAGRSREEAAKTLEKRYADQGRRARQARSRDVFSVYMNALAQSWDPHTTYLPPRDAENFDIRMKLSLTGIGALLSVDGEFTRVQSLIAGGPAEKGGDLQAGDLITGVAQGDDGEMVDTIGWRLDEVVDLTGVAQGDDGEMVDTIGWRLDEVVDLIRGPKETIVRLEILPAERGAGGKSRTIRIVRDKVKLEDQAAKHRVIEVKRGEKRLEIGIIALPTFYADIQAARRRDPNYRSSTRDVARIIAGLRESGVDGIVMDLRGNGGGSLFEAIDLTGLFVGPRPILQVKNAEGRIQVLRSTKPAAYDGPLLVLVNRMSASASEIFAAAIQDYGRGVVVGETSFGKGTVQNIAPLDHGQLKLTRAQFYRVTGGSTQIRGVSPDLALPGWIDPEQIGESALDEALPWDRIPAVEDVKPLGNVGRAVPGLMVKHRERIAADPDFAFLRARRALLDETRGTTLLSLDLEAREAERKALEKRLLDAENRWRKARGLTEVESPTTPSAPEFDPWAAEAANILADAIFGR